MMIDDLVIERDPHDDDEFWCVETGDTVESALEELKASSGFASYCDELDCDTVEVFVFHCVKPEDSSWPEDEREPHWTWCAEHQAAKYTINVVRES